MNDVKFVAEISSNHNGSLKRSIKLIQAAAEAGCDAVKFQLFKIDSLFAPEILRASKMHRDRKAWELPLNFIPELAKITQDLGMEFSCTPFYIEAVEELEPYVDFYKIASYELLWHDIFKRCAATGKPLVFSTGMASQEEVKAVLTSLSEFKGLDITALRCTSAYPTPVAEANLSSINSLRKALAPFQESFTLSYGWSDHTVSQSVILSAILKYRSSFVEFHFDLDGEGEEFGPGHCWLPHQIEKLIKIVNAAELADGAGSIAPGQAELADRNWRTDPTDGLRPLKTIRMGYSSE